MSELTGRELDAAIARRVMGWEVPYCHAGGGTYRRMPNGAWVALPLFSTSLDACREAEQEMGRRGLMDRYAKQLLERFAAASTIREYVLGAYNHLVMADAETRCRAMLAALDEIPRARGRAFPWQSV